MLALEVFLPGSNLPDEWDSPCSFDDVLALNRQSMPKLLGAIASPLFEFPVFIVFLGGCLRLFARLLFGFSSRRLRFGFRPLLSHLRLRRLRLG